MKHASEVWMITIMFSLYRLQGTTTFQSIVKHTKGMGLWWGRDHKTACWVGKPPLKLGYIFISWEPNQGGPHIYQTTGWILGLLCRRQPTRDGCWSSRTRNNSRICGEHPITISSPILHLWRGLLWIQLMKLANCSREWNTKWTSSLLHQIASTWLRKSLVTWDIRQGGPPAEVRNRWFPQSDTNPNSRPERFNPWDRPPIQLAAAMKPSPRWMTVN